MPTGFPDMYYQANPAVSTRRIGDNEAVLYHPDSGLEKVLNPSGLFIWQRLDGSRSVKKISDQVAGFFAAAPAGQIFEDATDFIVQQFC